MNTATWFIPLFIFAALPGCASNEVTPTPDIPATVAAAVEETIAEARTEDRNARRTRLERRTPTPDIEATVAAAVEETIAKTRARGLMRREGLEITLRKLARQEGHRPSVPLALTSMVERVRPGVVRIETTFGSGSGVIFAKDTGGSALVVTNYHVVDNENLEQVKEFYVDVIVNDLSVYDGVLVGNDTLRDLAVLKICCGEFTALPIANDNPAPGSEIVVMGYPLGLSGAATVTRGVVSAFRYNSGEEIWEVQTDASINSGNSGGPMLSQTGELVGIATSKIVAQDVEGVGFAVSVATLQEQLEALGVDSTFDLPVPPPVLPDQRPVPLKDPNRLSAAAVKLGVSESALLEALGPPPPDIAGTARRLGITTEVLISALGMPPAGQGSSAFPPPP